MPLRDFYLVLAVILLWAFNNIMIKLGLAEMPPLLMTTLRFMLVALLIVPFTRITRAQLPLVLMLAGTFGLMHFGFLFIGLKYAEAGTGALLVQLGTPFATILAAIFLKERLRLKPVIGMLVSFSGVVVLAGGPTLPGPLALTLLLLSALGWAITNLLVKTGPEIEPLTMAGWLSMLAIPLVGIGSLVFEQHQWTAMTSAGWRGWGAVVYSAVMSSIVAYGLWNTLLRRHSVERLIPLSLLTPVAVVLMGVVMLGESMAINKLAGGALVVGGIAIINIRRPRRPIARPTLTAEGDDRSSR
ncbi:O-acetylserine/cysteine efflux transporter [Kushneria avicenniae]|uniref:O-acetylserine/cysteine efflux transporter n=1 Tax=Kushneria avicenniae TaxID=402385 RepID=A0A1I1MKU6_9GAMM|nr:EamA family transporter [Kushneria avicenniae]SFC86124.1 O-acetylserine/cysteine efflux transporter [Kushneria avicenniae]